MEEANGPTRADVEAATAGIGTRLANARNSRRLRVSVLARQAGVSPSMISQIERGSSKPSVGTLFALAQVLGVPVDMFFTDGDVTDDASPPRSEPASTGEGDGVLDRLQSDAKGGYRPWTDATSSDRAVVRRADRASLEIRGGVRWERLTATPLDGIEFLELVYRPGAESDRQAYRHPGIELVLVTHGTMTIFLGFDRHELHPGDSIAFASSTPHRYVNLTDVEARAVTIILRDDLSMLPIREPQNGPDHPRRTGTRLPTPAPEDAGDPVSDRLADGPLRRARPHPGS